MVVGSVDLAHKNHMDVETIKWGLMLGRGYIEWVISVNWCRRDVLVRSE